MSLNLVTDHVGVVVFGVDRAIIMGEASTISSSSCADEARASGGTTATVKGQGIVQNSCDQFPGWGKTSAFQVCFTHPSDPVDQDPRFFVVGRL